MSSTLKIPRLVLAALKGGAGKTLITMGILRAMIRKGLIVAPFKKGPDYIDAGWLGLAARRVCFNLDAYMTSPEQVIDSFVKNSYSSDIAVIEGNRGIFDGVNAQGTFSTAELAKLINAPTIIIVDVTKVTRTVAAFVLGCKLLDPDLSLEGIILNRVAGTRHETVVRDAVEYYCGIPVIGAIPKLSLADFPQRHLGLIPLYEHPRAEEFVDTSADIVSKYINLDVCAQTAQSAADLVAEDPSLPQPKPWPKHSGLRIGVIRDSSFQFYYPENLEALQNTGASLIELNALQDRVLPSLDALYIGGGFPETHAERLSSNKAFKNSVMDAAKSGLPIYAECGGLIYLCRKLHVDNHVYPMVGVFPIDATLHRRPQGHGYIEVKAVRKNPFYPIGTSVRGHEFHYSSVSGVAQEKGSYYCLEVIRGHGFDGKIDGICIYNCFGTYVHVHANGTPSWSKGILDAAEKFSKKRGRMP